MHGRIGTYGTWSLAIASAVADTVAAPPSEGNMSTRRIRVRGPTRTHITTHKLHALQKEDAFSVY